MRDALKPALGAAFKAAGCPSLCARHRDWGMGAGAPTGLRPGECTRVRAAPQAVQAAGRCAKALRAAGAARAEGISRGRLRTCPHLLPHLALASREMLKHV